MMTFLRLNMWLLTFNFVLVVVAKVVPGCDWLLGDSLAAFWVLLALNIAAGIGLYFLLREKEPVG